MNGEVVVDGSVSAAWLLPDENTESCERLLGSVLSGKLQIVVPELWPYKMLNVLRTAVVQGRMDEQVAMRALSLLCSIPLETISVEAQGQSAILSDALRLGLSAYGAAYFNLAESRGVHGERGPGSPEAPPPVRLDCGCPGLPRLNEANQRNRIESWRRPHQG